MNIPSETHMQNFKGYENSRSGLQVNPSFSKLPWLLVIFHRISVNIYMTQVFHKTHFGQRRL